MKNLQKIIVLCLVVVVVTVVLFAGVHQIKEKEARKGPGPQVPVESLDIPSQKTGDAPEELTVVTTDPSQGNEFGSVSPPEAGISVCTADAKICPDGSAVSRTGPNCEFTTCPSQTITVSKRCTPAQKNADVCTMQYAPVCGLVEVQCVTTPCDPVLETFGNACSACAQGNVVSYSEGECSL
jgi:hypothetical protein